MSTSIISTCVYIYQNRRKFSIEQTFSLFFGFFFASSYWNQQKDRTQTQHYKSWLSIKPGVMFVVYRSHQLDWDTHPVVADLRPDGVPRPAFTLWRLPDLRAVTVLPVGGGLHLPGGAGGRSSPLQIPHLSQATFHRRQVCGALSSPANLPSEDEKTFIFILLLNILHGDLRSLSCSFSFLFKPNAQR